MKNLKYKVIISILVFILVAAATIVVTRVTEEERAGRTVMSSAQLPVVYMVSEAGTEYNLLHGYVTHIDELLLHECITPLPEDRKLTIRINSYDQNIEKISYEIRSLDGTEFIESTDVINFAVESDYTEAVLNIKNLLEADEEYMLKILVTVNQKTASYYTRIVYSDDLQLDEKMDYVLHFSEVTYDDEAINEIIPKLEPDSTGDNTNLGHVNIHSRLSQVGWGALEPTISSQVWPYVVEIEGNTADIRLDYQVTTEASEGLDTYDVTEFFRIRRADETTTYVLSYDRWVDQIFDGIDDLNDSGRIYLGITSGLEGDMQLASNSNGKVTCFVRRGELWSYSTESNSFVRIFSFMDSDSEYDAIRESYDQHGIKILSVDGDGTVRFVVYGYMNRGAHEGEMGVSVCIYNPEDNIVEEILYVPRNEIYDMIKQDVEKLVYLNVENRFFMYQNKSIYSIDCDTKEYMVVSENAIGSSCFFAEKNSVFVYQEGDDINSCNTIHMIQLETGETGKIEAESGQYLKNLGLIDGNIIYGMAYADEIYYDENDIIVYPMYRLEIIDSTYEIVKDYQIEDIRILSVKADDTKIIIERAAFDENGTLVSVSEDQLLSKTVTSETGLEISVIATEIRQKESYISLSATVPSSELTKVVYPKPIRFDAEVIIYMSEVTAANPYYRVYGAGKLQALMTSLGEAIAYADEWAGVVVAPSGAVVWDRYKPTTANVALTENYTLANQLNITGCNLDEALYYVAEGMVLRIKISPEEYVILNAYDRNNVQTINESTGIVVNYLKTELSTIWQDMDGIVFAYEVERK